jgi:DNA-directed RNA polymerase specialized sigma24 family protein
MEADVELEEVEKVYRDHADQLWRALVLWSGSVDVASDAVAEAFAQMLARGGRVRDKTAWVRRAAYRIAAGELKKGRMRTAFPAEVPVEGPDPLVDVMRALRTLTPHQRAAVVLADYAGYPHAEIARVIGSTPGAVALHVYRGRRRLRQLLEDHDDG